MRARDVHNELASSFGEVSTDLSHERIHSGLKQTRLPLMQKLSIKDEEL